MPSFSSHSSCGAATSTVLLLVWREQSTTCSKPRQLKQDLLRLQNETLGSSGLDASSDRRFVPMDSTVLFAFEWTMLRNISLARVHVLRATLGSPGQLDWVGFD